MAEQTFNFKAFLNSFIEKAAVLENMNLSNNMSVNEYVVRTFDNEDILDKVVKLSGRTEEEQAYNMAGDARNLQKVLTEIPETNNPRLTNVQTVFKRTIAFAATVYANLIEQYSSLYFDEGDEVITAAEELKATINKVLTPVTEPMDGIWDLPMLNKETGPRYFTTAALTSLILGYKHFIEELDEKDAKAVEKAEKDAAKEDDSDNEKELLERWRQAEWTGISSAVDSLLATLEALYKSGIESLPAVGILINNGMGMSPLISAKTIKKGNELSTSIVNEIDTGSRFDLKIMTVIAKYLDSLNHMDGIDPKTGFPTYDALMTNKGTMRNAHLMFQTASIPFSGHDNNKNSIRKWISATKGMNSDEWLKQHNNGKTTCLCKWSDVKDWYRWVIENTLFRYFTAAGLTPESDFSEGETTERITNIFIKKIKNVVSVSERVSRKSRMETTELKIATDRDVDIDALAVEIAAILNVGNAKDITCKARMLSNQVFALTIVYDQAAANKSTKFAAEIIDTVIASGNTPSWDNVLIGKKQSGDLLFWDFMHPGDAASCSYAIYAGSGAGKGNMTLTLMAAALADGKQLFYTDGKPDSGGSIAALAWKDKREAYMFDGQPKGTGSSFPGILEEHPVVNGMRSLAEVTQTASSIPMGIFTEHEATMFLGTCRYLRSLQLCVEILNARGANQLPKDEWQVWVFDEMTAMSENEREIRKAMGAYVAKKGYGNCFTLTKASKDNPKNSNVLIAAKEGEKLEEAKQADTGVAYIYDWLTWTASIVSQVPSLVKIGLRQADANIFLIFQKADWLSEHGGVTAISMFATALDCRKIVGANGLAPQCGQYGNGYTMNTNWYKEFVSKGNGWWAMSHSSDLGKAYSEDDVTIIKPYSIWGYRKAGDTTSPAENFFDYYVDKLSVVCRRPVSETLQAAYDYANTAVQTLASTGRIVSADNVKAFIYNVSNFSVEGAQFDPSTLYDKLKESGIETQNSPTNDYNKPLGENITSDETDIELANEDGYLDDYASEEESTAETPLFNFEKKNDGLDEAREAQARARYEQQKELERLRELAGSSTTAYAKSEELADKLKNISGLSGDAYEQAIKEMSEQILAGDWTIHKNMPQVSFEEAEKAGTVTAHDTSEIFKRGKNGERLFDSSEVPADNKRVLTDGNYVNFPHPVLANSFFEGNNVRKMEKGKTNAWKDFVKRLIVNMAGRNSITTLTVTENEIIVNGKLVEHGFLENTYIHSLSQIADLKYLLEQLTNLAVLSLTQDMLNTLFIQTEDQYENPESKKTDRTFEEYIFLSLCPKLNKFIILDTKRSLTRAQFVEVRKNKKKQSSALYKRMKQVSDAKQGISKMKKQFIKNSGGTYHLSDTQSRYKASQPKYKFGIFGKALYKMFDKMAPDE